MELKLEPLSMDAIIELYPIRRGEAETLTLDQTILLFEGICKQGVAYTAVADNRPIAIGGVQVIDNGVGAAIILGTDRLKEHPKEFTELMSHMVEEIMDDLQLHRVQCDVLASKPEWVRWTKYLGFEEEGIMRKLRNNQDCVLLARVR